MPVERKRKIKRDKVQGAGFYKEGSVFNDRTTRALLDQITDPDRLKKPSRSEIESAQRYIRWYERHGSIPENWSRFKEEHNVDSGFKIGEFLREKGREQERESIETAQTIGYYYRKSRSRPVQLCGRNKSENCGWIQAH